ncbi:Type 1 glutamine amidotransferase-like domain-containing protein [Candidatus Riflebacteria bacterium]
MHPTAFVYSSHNRCEYIHRWWIVERALKSHDNKTILYLPMSEGGNSGAFGTPQQFGWGKFEWYLNFFAQYGLQAYPFYWNDAISREDAETFFKMLSDSEVVILGGGNTYTGMSRYKAMGDHYFGDYNLFKKVLHDRAKRGKLTVGFSAGADQLCEILSGHIFSDLNYPEGFGLAHNIIVTLHHDGENKHTIYSGAQKFPHCMVFGLPNDSGLGVSQGYLPSGNIWQLIDFVTDNSWDIPQEAFHIKTAMGVGIDHYYNDARDWTFRGGDRMARVMSPDSRWQEAFIFTAHGHCFHYGSQSSAGFGNPEEVFEHY